MLGDAKMSATNLDALVRPALDYGPRPTPAQGLYETLLVEDDRAVLLEEHLERLAASFKEVYGGVLDRGALSAAIRETAAGCGGLRSRLRIELDPDGSFELAAVAAGERSLETVVLAPFALPGGIGAHKWRDRRLMDALGAAAEGCMPLLLDADGTVLEAARANVWVREGEALLTPPADGRILPGVSRAELLAADPNAREQGFDLARLARADEVFLTGSVAGRRPARLVTAALGR